MCITELHGFCRGDEAGRPFEEAEESGIFPQTTAIRKSDSLLSGKCLHPPDGLFDEGTIRLGPRTAMKAIEIIQHHHILGADTVGDIHRHRRLQDDADLFMRGNRLQVKQLRETSERFYQLRILTDAFIVYIDPIGTAGLCYGKNFFHMHTAGMLIPQHMPEYLCIFLSAVPV